MIHVTRLSETRPTYQDVMWRVWKRHVTYEAIPSHIADLYMNGSFLLYALLRNTEITPASGV